MEDKQIIIHELEDEFIGIGEVKGIKFKKLKRGDRGYLFELTDDGGGVYYEIFQRKNSPVCIDFDKKIFSETEYKESYPKSNSFGLTAWTTKDYHSAIDIFDQIEKKEDNPKQ